MKKISVWEKVKALESVGFRWHAHGTFVSHGKKYDYYKGDTLTIDQKRQLKAKFGDAVAFFGSSAQYAPEIRGAIVGFTTGKKSASRKNPRSRGLTRKLARATLVARRSSGRRRLRHRLKRRLGRGRHTSRRQGWVRRAALAPKRRRKGAR